MASLVCCHLGKRFLFLRLFEHLQAHPLPGKGLQQIGKAKAHQSIGIFDEHHIHCFLFDEREQLLHPPPLFIERRGLLGDRFYQQVPPSVGRLAESVGLTLQVARLFLPRRRDSRIDHTARLANTSGQASDL